MYGSVLNQCEKGSDNDLNVASVDDVRLSSKLASNWRAWSGCLAFLSFASIFVYSSTTRRDLAKLKGESQFIATEELMGVTTIPKSGFNLLFDLNEDFNEATSLYDQSDYSSYVKSLLLSTAKWQTKVGECEDPSSLDKVSIWKKAGGVVPWLAGQSSRTITQKYSYKSAPHIVFFLVDDWGWNDIGYQSTYLNWTTPNIDKLASNGLKLTNYYTHELCVPSRAALMTGRYALRFGLHGAKDENAELYLSEVTLAEELKSAGYRTNLIGKWHLGMSSLSHTPTYRGFDHFYGFLGGFTDYFTKDYGNHLDFTDNTDLISSEAALSSSVHSEAVYAAEAVRVIEEHSTLYSSKPMFMYFASQLMHTPWEVPADYSARCADVNGESTSDEQIYCGMNLMLDEVVANITCALEANGMADNTIFVLASDNGGNNAMAGNTYPFRGGKGSLFRGGDSVPAFIYGSKGVIPSHRLGGSYDGQVHVTDWLPTLMGLATNGEWTGSYVGNTIDGVDMWDTIIANTDTKHTEIVHYLDFHGNVSIQIDMVKMMRFNSSAVGTSLAPDAFFANGNLDATSTSVCLFGSSSSSSSVSKKTFGSVASVAATWTDLRTMAHSGASASASRSLMAVQSDGGSIDTEIIDVDFNTDRQVAKLLSTFNSVVVLIVSMIFLYAIVHTHVRLSLCSDTEQQHDSHFQFTGTEKSSRQGGNTTTSSSATKHDEEEQLCYLTVYDSSAPFQLDSADKKVKVCNGYFVNDTDDTVIVA